MSTPLSRRSSLDGLALYAPRRAREQAAYDEPPADSPAPEDESADHRNATAAEPEDDGGTETELAEHRIEEAIRKIVALGHQDEAAMSSKPTMSSKPIMSSKPDGSSEQNLASADEARRSLAPHRHDEDEDEAQAPFTPRRATEDAQPRVRRRSRLDAEIVPEPVGARRSVFPLLIRLSSAMLFAAAVAYGMTMFLSMKSGAPREQATDYQLAGTEPKVQQSRPQPPTQPPHLIVEDQQAFANEPLSLIVVVQHPQQHASLLFDGLAQGTKLSAGTPTSASSWQVPYDQVQGLYLYAPKDFTGVMNTAVSLLGADKQLLDTQAVQLKWIARQVKAAPNPAPPPAAAPAAAQPKPAMVATAGDPTGAVAPNNVTIKSIAPGNADAPKTTMKPIDPGEAAMLMQRGRDFMDAGDVSAARVAFSRLADGGLANAALALANTYDPTYLAAHHVMGVQGDRETARTWYERAKELGSSEAAQMLSRMTGK